MEIGIIKLSKEYFLSLFGEFFLNWYVSRSRELQHIVTVIIKLV